MPDALPPPWRVVAPLYRSRGFAYDGTTLPQFYVGTAVKRAFGTVSPVVERMWIVVDGVTPEGHLLGRLLNTPVAACGYQRGDQVVVPLALIEEMQALPPSRRS